MEFSLTAKQWQFIQSDCEESLFGGAAGGGKSYALLVNALLFALRYAGSRQLLLRRTFPELRRSLILNSLLLYRSEEHILAPTSIFVCWPVCAGQTRSPNWSRRPLTRAALAMPG